MSININTLHQEHVGRWVSYVPHAGAKLQKGRIKGWNDKWVFVVYNCGGEWDKYQNYTGCATDPLELAFSKAMTNGELIEKLKHLP